MYDLMTRGGLLMWPLMLCSVVSVAVILERFWWGWRQSRLEAPAKVRELIELARGSRMQQAIELGDSLHDPNAKVLVRALVQREHGFEPTLQAAAQDRIEEMKRGLGVMDTVITVAPLLGILGTVTGIISSFSLLSATAIPDPRLVSEGIAEALITTAAGLVIAVFTLIPFNYFTARVQRATRELERLTTEFEVAYREATSTPQAQEARP